MTRRYQRQTRRVAALSREKPAGPHVNALQPDSSNDGVSRKGINGRLVLSHRLTLQTFLSNVRPGDYIAIQAYVHHTGAVDASLRTFRSELRDRLGLATTVGYGPRFLHSTGQLHKGDGGNGLFIQLTSDSASDLPIPDEAGSPNTTMSFGVLKLAQALGDAQALLDSDRRLIRFDLERDVVGGIERLSKAVSRVPVTVQ